MQNKRYKWDIYAFSTIAVLESYLWYRGEHTTLHMFAAITAVCVVGSVLYITRNKE